MDTQAVMMGSRVAHVRELKTELEKLKAENAALRKEKEELAAHLDLAILAAEDLREDGELEIWDGWNLILGAPKEARDRDDLVAQAKATGRRVWIVLDGPDPRTTVDGNVRITYTGGSGAHRADKLICDFLRMARFRGDLAKVSVRTNDKDFQKDVTRIRGLV